MQVSNAVDHRFDPWPGKKFGLEMGICCSSHSIHWFRTKTGWVRVRIVGLVQSRVKFSLICLNLNIHEIFSTGR